MEKHVVLFEDLMVYHLVGYLQKTRSHLKVANGPSASKYHPNNSMWFSILLSQRREFTISTREWFSWALSVISPVNDHFTFYISRKQNGKFDQKTKQNDLKLIQIHSIYSFRCGVIKMTTMSWIWVFFVVFFLHRNNYHFLSNKLI